MRYGKNSTSITISPIDHTLVAKACGMESIRVETFEELQLALDRARTARGSVLIDVLCTPDAPPITDFVGK